MWFAPKCRGLWAKEGLILWRLSRCEADALNVRLLGQQAGDHDFNLRKNCSGLDVYNSVRLTACLANSFDKNNPSVIGAHSAVQSSLACHPST